MERFDVRIGLEISWRSSCRFITNRFEPTKRRNSIDVKRRHSTARANKQIELYERTFECALAEPYWMGCGYWTLNVTWLERQFNIEFVRERVGHICVHNMRVCALVWRGSNQFSIFQLYDGISYHSTVSVCIQSYWKWSRSMDGNETMELSKGTLLSS